MSVIAPSVEYKAQNDPPFELPSSVELRTDLIYATALGEDWRLDLFVPRERAVSRSGVVYVHGGGWRGGTRQQFWRHAAHMAARGFVGACIQYPLTPRHTYPRQLELPQAAVRWLRHQSDELGVDPSRIGAVGGSAGGHLVALLGCGDDVQDGVSAKVDCVVAFNGVFDLASMLTEAATSAIGGLIGGNVRYGVEGSPLSRATASAAPTLLLHGDADTTVPYAQSVAYQRRLNELGVRAELYTEPGAAHGFFNRAPYFQRTLPVMERFLTKTLCTTR